MVLAAVQNKTKHKPLSVYCSIFCFTTKAEPLAQNMSTDTLLYTYTCLSYHSSSCLVYLHSIQTYSLQYLLALITLVTTTELEIHFGSLEHGYNNNY